MYYPPTGSLKGCTSDCRRFAKEMFFQEQVHTASGRFEIPFIMNYINVQLRLISSDVQMTYRWCTDDVQMTYRWDPINLSEMHEGIVYQILSAFTWHKLYLVMRLLSEMLWEPYFCLRALNEWLLVVGWLVIPTTLFCSANRLLSLENLWMSDCWWLVGETRETSIPGDGGGRVACCY